MDKGVLKRKLLGQLLHRLGRIGLNGLDSETNIDGLEQIDLASCQLVSSGSGSNDTSTAAEAQGDGLTPNTLEIGLVAKD